MNCPQCQMAMEHGWLVIYEPIIITQVVWQPVQPGYIRIKTPPGSVKVIQPLIGGGGSPEAYLCRTCQLTVTTFTRSAD